MRGVEGVRNRLLGVLGWTYLVLGLALNPWTLGRLLSQDGRINSLKVQLAIIGVEALAIAWGLLTLKARRSDLILNLNVLVFAIGLGTLVLAELGFRIGIALHVSALRKPGLYANWYSDDDYWKLQQEWQGRWKHQIPEEVQPLLGWSQAAVTSQNPLGLRDTSLARLHSPGPKILFYGDSYVRGEADPAFELPEFLQHRLSQTAVVDLSSKGYGLDQIYLIFRETLPLVPHPRVLVGLLVSDDLDRTVLRVRTSQKPYFVVDSTGNLTLRGVPIERDQEGYFHRLRLSFSIYLVAFLKQRLVGPNLKIPQKQAVADRLFDRFASEARAAGAELRFVLFYSQPDLTRVTWQEAFIKKELAAKRIEFLDTKPILLRYSHDKNVSLDAFYKPGDGHHNNLGNQVIGDGLIEALGKGK